MDNLPKGTTNERNCQVLVCPKVKGMGNRKKYIYFSK